MGRGSGCARELRQDHAAVAGDRRRAQRTYSSSKKRGIDMGWSFGGGALHHQKREYCLFAVSPSEHANSLQRKKTRPNRGWTPSPERKRGLGGCLKLGGTAEYGVLETETASAGAKYFGKRGRGKRGGKGVSRRRRRREHNIVGCAS